MSFSRKERILAMPSRLVLCLIFAVCSAGFADEVFHERFSAPGDESPLKLTWGDKPAEVVANAVEPDDGVGGSPAVHLRLRFPEQVAHHLSYWTYTLARPVPLIPELTTVSFAVKTNVPVMLKVGLAPFGFIYHGPRVEPAAGWQRVILSNAYEELRKWCARGGRDAADAWLSTVIVAVVDQPAITADVVVDDIVLAGSDGAAKAARTEAFTRRLRRVDVAAVSLPWDQGHRTLAETLAALDETGRLGADLACLPQECVAQPPEPIPGPASEAMAKKAAQYKMYIVGNLRERVGTRIYITSFLLDRRGKLVGKYRKSHHLPYETDFALGDDLPTFATDFGCVGLKVGTDQYFPEIDAVLRRRGASLVVWSTRPFPDRDEHFYSLMLRGRAAENDLYQVVARYAGVRGYGGYPDRFSWTASWPLGRAQVIAPDGHTIADSGHRGGVALASIPRSRLGGVPRDGGFSPTGPFALIASSRLPPPPRRGKRHVIKVAAIECETDLDRLHEKLEECGKQGVDLTCLWEYVWYHSDAEVEKYRARNHQRLERIAQAARRYHMYILIAGELERGFNESILFDRQGAEVGRYTKIVQTTSKDSKYYQAGDHVGLFEVDFGRLCTKICADVGRPEIDRVAGLSQVDLMLLSTQDAGPYCERIRLREALRCVDNGYFLVRAAGGDRESDHRTYLMDPWGMVLAASQFGVNNPPVISTIDLDNRPRYYEWPEKVRAAGDYPDPVKRGLPAEQRLKMYGRFNRPVAKGDLRAVILANRRPKLYRPRKEAAP